MSLLRPLLCALLCTLLFSGCVTVHPWERGLLADPVMQPELVPGAVELEQHMLATLEASAGGYGIAGGGCGCN